MPANADPRQTGTGQEGARAPKGVNDDSPTSTNPDRRVEKIADELADRGFERERKSDPTEFTK